MQEQHAARTMNALSRLIVIGFLFVISVSTQAGGFTVEKTKAGVTVNYDGKLFTRYIIGQSNKPFLWPVIGPNGAEMTRAYPMEKREGEKHDHPHHRSLWFGHQGVGGFDTWHEPMTTDDLCLPQQRRPPQRPLLRRTLQRPLLPFIYTE